MSTARTAAGGWADLDDLPKGPNGRALCRRCSLEVPVGRKTFCSKECVHEWKLRTDATYLRLKVFERDEGVCADCGADTMANCLRRRSRGTGHLWQADHIVPVVEGGGECCLSNLQTLCTACHKKATGELRRRMAERRKEEKALPLMDCLVQA